MCFGGFLNVLKSSKCLFIFVIFSLYALMKGNNNLGRVLINRCENFQRVVDVSARTVSWEIPKFLHADYCINVAKIILS